jgi:DeoR family deoxyribose operon repressor
MKKTERLKTIMQTLRINNVSSVEELSRQLKVSHMTVRRDLISLEEEEEVRVLYGSVILHPRRTEQASRTPYSLIAAGTEFPEEKRKIGQLAASLIKSQDSLIVDVGSTTEYLAKYLPEDIEYTVLCYSLNIIAESARRKNCKSIFSGGLYHENTMMFESPEGLETIRNFRATKAFLAAAGVDPRCGVTCMNAYERETKKVVMQSTQKAILLVDSSKFGVVRSDYFADLSAFDEIITDAGIPDEYIAFMEAMGITVRIA